MGAWGETVGGLVELARRGMSDRYVDEASISHQHFSPCQHIDGQQEYLHVNINSQHTSPRPNRYLSLHYIEDCI